MKCNKVVCFLLIVILAIAPTNILAQFPIDPDAISTVFEILDLSGTRLAVVVITGSSGRGFEAGNEYWTFSEDALLDIAEQESLEISILAEGDWDNRWVVEALAWQPDGEAVEWSHPATVEWNDDSPPVVPGGAYFGNATLGGLTIQYSPRGASSLTWFKLTEGPHMLIGEGAVFERDGEVPETGAWWQGEI